MPLFFLIPLCTALVTGYFFTKSTDEVAYLAGVFAGISLILSLVLAPWQIQLVLLIVVLISTNRLLQKNEYKQTEATGKPPR
jgi:predicted membrane protein